MCCDISRIVETSASSSPQLSMGTLGRGRGLAVASENGLSLVLLLHQKPPWLTLRNLPSLSPSRNVTRLTSVKSGCQVNFRRSLNISLKLKTTRFSSQVSFKIAREDSKIRGFSWQEGMRKKSPSWPR